MTTLEGLPTLSIPRPRITRGLLAKALVGNLVDRMPVRLMTPDGRTRGGGDETSPVLYAAAPDLLYRRLEAHPKIGLGEAYMAGEWEAGPGTDLADALTPFAERLATAVPRPLRALRGVVDQALPSSQRNTLTGSRANIEAHYDLSNDLFAAFLDETMTYSSALFSDDVPWGEQDLAVAQRRKIDAVLDAAGVGADSRVLEIGTGWGELALRAAQRGALVTSITLSSEQRALALQRLADAGMSERVQVRLQDYREVRGEFDAVVSVEMIEAVGEEFWPAYFATLDERLAPGGRAVIQAIVMDHQRYLTTRNSYGWIQKYIFPGGLIPSVRAIEDVTRTHTGLRVTRVDAFGQHYAETLRRWRVRFLEQWPQIAGHGFDDTFRRMWEFYLAYCEAGFRATYLDVAHVTMRRP